MLPVSSKKFYRISLCLTTILPLLLAFQNCSPATGLKIGDEASIEDTQSTEDSSDSENQCLADEHLEDSTCVKNLRACSILNGTGTQTWTGADYSACTPKSCNTNYQPQGNACVYVPGACPIVNGAGLTQEDGSCKVNSCMTGYHIAGNLCESNVQTCAITNGVGERTWNGNAFGSCMVKSCNANYRIEGNLCVQIPPPPVGGDKVIRIMPLGDSLTYGFLGEATGGYRGPLYEMLTTAGYKVEFVGSLNCKIPVASPKCQGHSGWTIAQIQESVVNLGLLEQAQPDVIIMMIGGNTLLKNPVNGDILALQQLPVLIDSILTRLPQVRLIVASTLQAKQGNAANLVPKYNAGIPAIVDARKKAGFNISFVDMYPVVPLTDMPDLLHPNVTGYAKLAQAWYQTLVPVLK